MFDMGMSRKAKVMKLGDDHEAARQGESLFTIEDPSNEESSMMNLEHKVIRCCLVTLNPDASPTLGSPLPTSDMTLAVYVGKFNTNEEVHGVTAGACTSCSRYSTGTRVLRMTDITCGIYIVLWEEAKPARVIAITSVDWG